jgi:phosphoglycolate phosphatase
LLIVFDLDGTLVDSRRDLADSANAMLARYGAPQLPEELIIPMVGDGAPLLVQRVCRAAGLSIAPDDALQHFLALYDARLLNHTNPYPGTREMLEACAKKATLTVLTNKPGALSSAILKGTGLLAFFRHIIGGDGQWGRKPSPQGLQWLIEEAGETSASTLIVGDSIVDLQTARAGGIAFCLARYGFGVGSVPSNLLTTEDRVIDRPIELVNLL